MSASETVVLEQVKKDLPKSPSEIRFHKPLIHKKTKAGNPGPTPPPGGSETIHEDKCCVIS